MSTARRWRECQREVAGHKIKQLIRCILQQKRNTLASSAWHQDTDPLESLLLLNQQGQTTSGHNFCRHRYLTLEADPNNQRDLRVFAAMNIRAGEAAAAWQGHKSGTHLWMGACKFAHFVLQWFFRKTCYYLLQWVGLTGFASQHTQSAHHL